MPSPRSIIPNYPSKEFIDILKVRAPEKLYVYVDLKNVMTSLFIEDVCTEILANSETMKFMDSSIFQSVIFFSSWWMNLSKNLNIKEFKIFFCTDIGKSNYHLNIDKRYKRSREIFTFESPIHEERLKVIRDKNFQLSELICNKIPGVYFFCLKYLESDFLAHYLINNKFANENNIMHVVCSSDKDLYQSLTTDNIFMIYKNRGVKYVLDKTNVVKYYIKYHKLSPGSQAKNLEKIEAMNPGNLPLMMALVGDVGDDVEGVKGIGPLTSLKMMTEENIVNKIIGDVSEVNNRVASGGKFFKEDELQISKLPNNWKNSFLQNDLVTNSFKLVSFDQLCLWLEKRETTTKLDYLKYIDRILSKEKIELIENAQTLMIPLSKIEDCQLSKDDISSLFG